MVFGEAKAAAITELRVMSVLIFVMPVSRYRAGTVFFVYAR